MCVGGLGRILMVGSLKKSVSQEKGFSCICLIVSVCVLRAMVILYTLPVLVRPPSQPSTAKPMHSLWICSLKDGERGGWGPTNLD